MVLGPSFYGDIWKALQAKLNFTYKLVSYETIEALIFFFILRYLQLMGSMASRKMMGASVEL